MPALAPRPSPPLTRRWLCGADVPDWPTEFSRPGRRLTRNGRHPDRAGRRDRRAGARRAGGRPAAPAGRDPGADGGQPEGRGRQDHHDRQPRRRPGPARAARAGRRPRPAGQRVDRARRRPPRRGARRSTTCWSTARPLPRWSQRRSTGSPACGARRRPSTWPAPRSSWSPWWPASPGCARRSTAYAVWCAEQRRRGTASTTSSSTARRRSACSRSTRWSPAPEVLIPIQCEYYALEGLGQLLENIELVKAHLNPRPARLDHPADDVRRPHPARGAGRRGGPHALRRPGAARRPSRARCGSPRRRATARP